MHHTHTNFICIFMFLNFFSDANNSTCSENQFQCKTAGIVQLGNKKCIPYDLVCNKENDCPDGSDEPLHCGVNECARGRLYFDFDSAMGPIIFICNNI